MPATQLMQAIGAWELAQLRPDEFRGRQIAAKSKCPSTTNAKERRAAFKLEFFL